MIAIHHILLFDQNYCKNRSFQWKNAKKIIKTQWPYFYQDQFLPGATILVRMYTRGLSTNKQMIGLVGSNCKSPGQSESLTRWSWALCSASTLHCALEQCCFPTLHDPVRKKFCSLLCSHVIISWLCRCSSALIVPWTTSNYHRNFGIPLDVLYTYGRCLFNPTQSSNSGLLPTSSITICSPTLVMLDLLSSLATQLTFEAGNAEYRLTLCTKMTSLLACASLARYHFLNILQAHGKEWPFRSGCYCCEPSEVPWRIQFSLTSRYAIAATNTIISLNGSGGGVSNSAVDSARCLKICLLG